MLKKLKDSFLLLTK